MKFISIPGTTLLVPELDNAITKFAVEAGRLDWDPLIRELPELHAVKRDQAILDVGAYIGDTTTAFCNVSDWVFAFEPREDIFAVLENNCPDAICVNAAVGDGSPYEMPFLGCGGNLGGRWVVKDEQSTRHSLRLDDLPLDRVAFLKIDAEGFEPFVLKGARETIRTHKPVVVIEVNELALVRQGRSPDDIYQFFDGWEMRDLWPGHEPKELLFRPRTRFR